MAAARDGEPASVKEANTATAVAGVAKEAGTDTPLATSVPNKQLSLLESLQTA